MLKWLAQVWLVGVKPRAVHKELYCPTDMRVLLVQPTSESQDYQITCRHTNCGNSKYKRVMSSAVAS